jgi:uncharacterized membrane protein
MKTRDYNLLVAFGIILGLMGFISADAGEVCGMEVGYGFGIFSWIFGVLILIALILLIVWLIKQIQNKKVDKVIKEPLRIEGTKKNNRKLKR